jgi:hypothetical protein
MQAFVGVYVRNDSGWTQLIQVELHLDTVLQACGEHGIVEQHCDRHWTDSTWNGGYIRRDLAGRFEIHITHQFPVDTADANVYNCCPGLDHVGSNLEFSPMSDPSYQHVSLFADFFEIVRL